MCPIITPPAVIIAKAEGNVKHENTRSQNLFFREEIVRSFPVFLVEVPDSVDVEVPPPPETEPPTTAPEETGPDYVPVAPSNQNKVDPNVQIAGFIVSAILMAGGIALVLLDRKKAK